MSMLTLPNSSPVASDDEALTVRQIAALMGVSIATVNRRIAAGELPAVMFRGAKYALRSDVEDCFAPHPVPVEGSPIDEACLARLQSLLGGR